MTIKKTKYHSYCTGKISKGCSQCVRGEKTVLFITGLCPRNCSYCPISDQKHQKDVTYANEWPTSDIRDIIKEIELCGSLGVGFTGGDPLVKIHRCVTYIKKLKKHFGSDFHIHLYTSFDLADSVRLKKLYDAGLDEIRFHPDIDDDKLWSRIDRVLDFDWDIDVEIPAIPGKEKEIKKLMHFFNGKIKFLNINELEVSDATANKLSEQGFITKDKLSYGVRGSETLAKKLLEFALREKLKYPVHYCTAKLKDKIQLSKRIAKRGKNAKQEFDILNKDGTLTRGAIYLDFLYPGEGYSDKLSKLNLMQRKNVLKKLEIVRKNIAKEFEVPLKYLMIDKVKLRLLTNPGVVMHLSEEISKRKLKGAIVTEYPTWDAMIVELDWV